MSACRSPREMKYRYLLFDADNTIFDFSASEERAFRAMLSEFGVPYRDGMLENYVEGNNECWREMERGEIRKEALLVKRFALFCENCGVNKDPAAMNASFTRHLSQIAVLLPGAREMLARLSERAQIYIVTNGVTSVQEGRFNRTDLHLFVKKVFISEQMGTKKPDALFFEKVGAAIPSYRKERALVIGDSLTSDVRGANNAGLDCVWYNPGSEALPKGYCVNAVAHDFIELESFITGEYV